jgi:hypothetical protein
MSYSGGFVGTLKTTPGENHFIDIPSLTDKGKYNMLLHNILRGLAMAKVSSREAALILLYALAERGQRRGKELTRARVSQVSLKRLWNRENLNEAWLAEVNDWLLSAGWTLFHAGTTFGVVKKGVVENWPRIASKRIQDVLDQVASGPFEFGSLEHLLQPTEPGALTLAQAPTEKRKRSSKSRRNT